MHAKRASRASGRAGSASWFLAYLLCSLARSLARLLSLIAVCRSADNPIDLADCLTSMWSKCLRIEHMS